MTRAAQLAANARAIASSLAGLARGMVDIPSEQLDSMAPIEIPEVDSKQLDSFVDTVADQTKGDALVLLGLSSPDMLRRFRDRLPVDRALVIVEPSLDIAIRLLSQHDFSDVLSMPYVSIVFGARDQALMEEFTILINQWGIGEIQMIPNPMRPMDERITTLVAGMIRDSVRAVELSSATGARYGPQVLASICANLDPAVSGVDLAELSQRYAGIPAFCVAAGPSLDRDIGLLAQARERGIIIAADAAVPVLMEAGIAPDVVTTIDVIDTKSVVFEKYYVKDALLVALLAAHPKIVNAWIGPRAFVVDNHPLALWASQHIVRPSHFVGLGNVAHLSFAFARGLGCDPVVLVGTDMAAGRDGRTYAKGVIHHPPEVQVLREEDMPKTTEVPANDGKPVRTFTNMVSYIHTFSNFALAGGAAFTTAAEGARITGIPHRPLKDLIAENDPQPIARPLAGHAPTRTDTVERRSALLKCVEELERDLERYTDDAEVFVEVAERARNDIARGEIDSEKGLRLLVPYIESLRQHKEIIEMIEPLQPAVIYELNRISRKATAMDNPVERAQARITTLAGASAGAIPLSR
ncbi:MAG: DUF115 domain-containing protein, partial [Planctomycetes bacterium]|nr:DUF115 domain-containing protein [Planctomycetota bacterium]